MFMRKKPTNITIQSMMIHMSIVLHFQVDPFHTLFGIAGLSLLDYSDDIKKVNPVFCMPEYVIQKLKHKPEIL